MDNDNRSALERFTGGLWRVENPPRRFSQWRDKGIWEELLDEVIEEPHFENGE